MSLQFTVLFGKPKHLFSNGGSAIQRYTAAGRGALNMFTKKETTKQGVPTHAETCWFLPSWTVGARASL